MPGLDGFETAEYVRRRERTRDVPIIFVTAAGKERRHVFQGYAVGAVDYVFKPYDPEVLRAKVAVFLRLHATTRAFAHERGGPARRVRLGPDRHGPARRRRSRARGQPRPRRAAGARAPRPGGADARRAGGAGGCRGAGGRPRRAAGRAPGPVRPGAAPRLRRGEAIPCLASFSLAQAPGQEDAVIAQVQDLRERRRAEAEREALVREQAAREEAERAAGRLRAVQRLSDAALAARTVDAVARELLLRVGEVVAADAAAVVLPRDDEAATVHRIEGSVRASLRTTTEPPPVLRPRPRRAGRRRRGRPRRRHARGVRRPPAGRGGARAPGRPAARGRRGRRRALRRLALPGGVRARGRRRARAGRRPRPARPSSACGASRRSTRSPRGCSAACRPPSCRACRGSSPRPATGPAGRAPPRSAATGTTRCPSPDGGLLLVIGDVAGRGVGGGGDDGPAAQRDPRLRAARRRRRRRCSTRVNAFHLGIASDTMATVLLARAGSRRRRADHGQRRAPARARDEPRRRGRAG